MSGPFIYAAIVVPAAVVIPLAMGICYYKGLRFPHRLIFYYLVFAGVTGGVASYFAKHRMNNLWLLHLYTAVEAVVLMGFYRSIIKSALLRKVILYLMALFPLICLANILWWQSLRRFNTYTRPVEALLLIYMGLVVFLENSNDPVDAEGGPSTALSWINAGLLLYFSTSFFFFIFSNFLHPEGFFNIFILISHATFVLIMYLLFTVGFYKCSRS